MEIEYGLSQRNPGYKTGSLCIYMYLMCQNRECVPRLEAGRVCVHFVQVLIRFDCDMVPRASRWVGWRAPCCGAC